MVFMEPPFLVFIFMKCFVKLDVRHFVQILPQKEWQSCVDEIYVTVDIRDISVELQNKYGIPIKNVFDFTHIFPEYRNPLVNKFKDRNKGERCFIVATGPSLRTEDLDKLKLHGEKSIGVNKIYLAFERTDWKPDYYIVSDHYCIEESGDEIKKIQVENKFVSDLYPEFWQEAVPDNIYKYHCHWSYTENCLAAFSDDIEYGVYASGTITYEALQLAVYLGFKEIYLLGVDFNFSEDYKDTSNHFVSNYYSPNSKTSYFLRKESLSGYRAAKQYADKHGIKIYNATRGGKLEVFERVDFDSLFEEDIKKESVE